MGGPKDFYRQNGQWHFSDEDGGGEATLEMIAEALDERTKDLNTAASIIKSQEELIGLYRRLDKKED